MASSLTTTPLSFSGCDSRLKAICLPPSTNFNPIHKVSALTLRTKSNRIRTLSVSARYRDGGGKSGGSEFVAGFLLGGAVFGTMAYILSPKIRKKLKEFETPKYYDEYGFLIPQQQNQKIYYEYDEGLEERRELLNKKISQLNSAIDKVSSRLRDGGSELLNEKISQFNSAMDKVSSRLRGDESGSGKDETD